MRGVTLLALGLDYAKWAFQMAMSIKRFSSIPIQLLTDGSVKKLRPFERKFFDRIDPVAAKDSYLDGRVFPALCKLKLYDYIAWDETIYLDVDGVALKALDPLFDEATSYYHSQLFGTGVKGEKEYDKMYWAYPADLWAHFDLRGDETLPFINSSFQYIQKGPEAKKLFEKALKNISDPLPVEKLRSRFGRGTHATKQPDELYMNVALAQVGHNPKLEPWPVYFNNATADSLAEITKNHYVLGLYGKRRDHTHSTVIKMYNRIVHNYMRTKHGMGIVYKADNLMRTKFIDSK